MRLETSVVCKGGAWCPVACEGGAEGGATVAPLVKKMLCASTGQQGHASATHADAIGIHW